MVTVSLAGTECPVQSVTDTQVVCITEAHRPSVKTKAAVEVNGNGIAKQVRPSCIYKMCLQIRLSTDCRNIVLQTSADFEYIDVWSSRFTWGDSDPPVEGDMVVIPKTMTVLLDTSTPVLSLLLIDGNLGFLYHQVLQCTVL